MILETDPNFILLSDHDFQNLNIPMSDIFQYPLKINTGFGPQLDFNVLKYILITHKGRGESLNI